MFNSNFPPQQGFFRQMRPDAPFWKVADRLRPPKHQPLNRPVFGPEAMGLGRPEFGGIGGGMGMGDTDMQRLIEILRSVGMGEGGLLDLLRRGRGKKRRGGSSEEFGDGSGGGGTGGGGTGGGGGGLGSTPTDGGVL